MNLNSPILVTAAQTQRLTAAREQVPGQVGCSRDGRRFRYIRYPAYAFVAENSTIHERNFVRWPIAGLTGFLLPAAIPANGTRWRFQAPATAATVAANELVGGYVQHSFEGTDYGTLFLIQAHEAFAANVTFDLEIARDFATPRPRPVSGSSRLIPPRWIETQPNAPSNEFCLLGVACTPLLLPDLPLAWGWVQTGGPVAVNASGAWKPGDALWCDPGAVWAPFKQYDPATVPIGTPIVARALGPRAAGPDGLDRADLLLD